MFQKPFCSSSLMHTPKHHTQLKKKKGKKENPEGFSSRPAAVPLDFHTFCAVHIVAFSVGSVILGVGGGSRFEVLRVLGEFHSLGLGPRLVAELDQRHHHGQPEASDKDIENPGNVAQAQSACLVLRETSHAISFTVRSRQTDRQQATLHLVLAGIATLMAFSVPLTDQRCPPRPRQPGAAQQ